MQFHDQSLMLPITSAARQTAQQFSGQQSTPQKSEQVRLNTLAVWVMRDYLAMMGIAADLEAGDSWNPVVRACANVADLEIVGAGRLECRPVRPYETQVAIPPEVWGERIGYVAVEIAADERRATICGFVSSAATPALLRSQLQPLSALLIYLSEFNIGDAATSQSEPLAGTSETLNRLEQWLQGMFTTGWQALEALLPPQETLAFQFRGGQDLNFETQQVRVQRAKLIELGPQSCPAMVLVVILQLDPQAQRLLRVQIHPVSDQPYLPTPLRLVILDEQGKAFLNAEARQRDDYLQLQFRGEPGEQFSVLITAGACQVTETFVI